MICICLYFIVIFYLKLQQPPPIENRKTKERLAHPPPKPVQKPLQQPIKTTQSSPASKPIPSKPAPVKPMAARINSVPAPVKEKEVKTPTSTLSGLRPGDILARSLSTPNVSIFRYDTMHITY